MIGTTFNKNNSESIYATDHRIIREQKPVRNSVVMGSVIVSGSDGHFDTWLLK